MGQEIEESELQKKWTWSAPFLEGRPRNSPPGTTLNVGSNKLHGCKVITHPTPLSSHPWCFLWIGGFCIFGLFHRLSICSDSWTLEA